MKIIDEQLECKAGPFVEHEADGILLFQTD